MLRLKRLAASDAALTWTELGAALEQVRSSLNLSPEAQSLVASWERDGDYLNFGTKLSGTLKDVPCPDDEWAIEWRKTVKEQHYKKNAQKAAIKALRPGDMVEFIDWNYAGQKKFEVASVEGNKILFYAASGKRVQLLHWRKAEFKIIKAN